MAKQTKTVRPCECSKFEAHSETSDFVWTTSCNSTTVSTFAPGHDAKLKGNLIRWAVLGYEIRKGDATKSAEGWADDYGFGYMVRAGIRRSAERGAAKAAKIVKRVTKAVKVETITAKVGRWTYVGTVANGTFTYLDKKDQIQRTTKFTQI